MSRFLVSQDCLDLGLRAGAILLRDIQVNDSSNQLRSQIVDETNRVRAQFTDVAEIRELPEFVKHHEILRAVGIRPRSHPPSTQKLMELALKRGELPAVNNLVDAYNLISLRTRCSLGAHDVDRIALPVELCLFEGDENFRPLGSDEDKQINRGEFGYVDADRRVICRLDSRQAEFSKVTAETTTALLIIESTTAQAVEQLERVFAETMAIVGENCGGSSEIVAFPR